MKGIFGFALGVTMLWSALATVAVGVLAEERDNLKMRYNELEDRHLEFVSRVYPEGTGESEPEE